jgi:hypothetical protein
MPRDWPDWSLFLAENRGDGDGGTMGQLGLSGALIVMKCLSVPETSRKPISYLN